MHCGAEENKLIVDSIDPRKVLDWINKVWAKSLAAVLMLLLGLYIGEMNAESRIVADCKFANAFRVSIQAFACQRKI
jgi:hypothetical protein